MYVFFAFPFAQLCNTQDGQVEEKFRDFFNGLKAVAKESKYDYFLAHERENWGADFKGPEECVPVDFEEIKRADLIIVVPGNPISGGVHIELGWASAYGKPLHIFLEKDTKYSPVVMGLKSLTEVHYHYTEGFPSNELLESIENVLKGQKECI